MSALNDLLWRVVNSSFLKTNKNWVLNQIGQPEIKNFNLIIESLVEICTYLTVKLWVQKRTVYILENISLIVDYFAVMNYRLI